MAEQDIRYEALDGVATITLDRPGRGNAMTYAGWAHLGRVLEGLARSDARVVVLQGAGASFCTGADLAGPDRADLPADQLRMVGETCLALHRMPQPTIARVQGHCVGAGAFLALGCDLVVAADDARLHLTFVRLALSPDFGGSWLLPRLVGHRRANELLLTGARVGATQALEWGLLTRVVPAAQLDEEVAGLVRELVAGSPLAQRQTKDLLRLASTATLADAVDAEGRAQTLNVLGPDFPEAVAAFREKRPPRFPGGR